MSVLLSVRRMPWRLHLLPWSRGLSSMKHFDVKVTSGGVAVVKLDSPSVKMNSLNNEVMLELQPILSRVREEAEIRAAVLISGKPGCFIAGADIKMLEAFRSAHETCTAIKKAQMLLEELSQLNKPVVAAIMGPCLGGGLEVAMACHYRIAINGMKTSLGLPEVLLGLLPGAGGTQRSLKLAGLPNALDLCLSGRTVNAKRAKAMGLVDLVVDPLGKGLAPADLTTHNYLLNVATDIARQLGQGTMKLPDRSASKGWVDKVTNWVLSFDMAKDYVFNTARKKVMKQTNGLYPAPLKILEVLRQGVDKGSVMGLEAEREAFGQLCMSNESKSLIGLFNGQTECKKNKFGAPEKPVQTIAVLGAGLMGAGIAEVSIDKGIKTILKDVNEDALARGVSQIQKGIDNKVKRKRVARVDGEIHMSNLLPTVDYAQLAKADLVVEAVFEDLELKHKVVKEVEAHIREDCILASNTSALPITSIASVSQRPQQMIGLHYFSPVDKMQLLEVICTKETRKEVASAAVDLGLRQGKVVIVVSDGPGFYTTRLIAPTLSEAIRALQEGVSPGKLDALTKNYGFPVGVATLADEVGLDVANHVAEDLGKAFGTRFSGGNPEVLRQLVDAGMLGRKSGKGLFIYDSKKSNSSTREANNDALRVLDEFKLDTKPELLSDSNIQLRLVTRFVNEAVNCLQDGVLKSPLEGDIGAVFGLGFPPMKGGPFRFVDTNRPSKIVSILRGFEEQYGDAFTPCQMLLDMAKSGERFYTKK